MIYESSAIRTKLEFIFSFLYGGNIINCREKGLFHTSYSRDLWIVMNLLETHKEDFEVTYFLNAQFVIKIRGPAKEQALHGGRKEGPERLGLTLT